MSVHKMGCLLLAIVLLAAAGCGGKTTGKEKPSTSAVPGGIGGYAGPVGAKGLANLLARQC